MLWKSQAKISNCYTGVPTDVTMVGPEDKQLQCKMAKLEQITSIWSMKSKYYTRVILVLTYKYSKWSAFCSQNWSTHFQ